MDLNAWQQITNLKGNLLNVTSLLLEDHVVKRESISSRMFEQVKDLNGLEEYWINEIKNNETNHLPDYYKAWGDIAALKAKLLNIGNELLVTEGKVSREEIAIDLLTHIELLNTIENDCINLVRKEVYLPLYKQCEEVETLREQSKKQPTANELFNA